MINNSYGPGNLITIARFRIRHDFSNLYIRHRWNFNSVVVLVIGLIRIISVRSHNSNISNVSIGYGNFSSNLQSYSFLIIQSTDSPNIILIFTVGIILNVNQTFRQHISHNNINRSVRTIIGHSNSPNDNVTHFRSMIGHNLNNFQISLMANINGCTVIIVGQIRIRSIRSHISNISNDSSSNINLSPYS